jgi:solute carrier family 10 (sodium/bile acid cotransporter), member 7
MKMTRLLKKAGLNGFFLLLLVMVLLAWLIPEWGASSSPIPLKTITNFGVALIFFFYGVKLDPEKLRAGLGHWKLHLLIQGTTFLIFPLLVLLVYPLLSTDEFELWWIGIFYLAALPSTVSSSVVMVSIAGGNISAAIFNASISSLIGIFITPLWMSIFIDSSALSIGHLSDVILNLVLQILLPVIIGVLLHAKLGYFVAKYKDSLRHFDQTIILLIVFRAFSESFSGNMFEGYRILEITLLGVAMLVFFLVMLFIMQVLSSWMKFSREDRITILFCGSKKSLVQGAVMGQVLFPQATIFGIILLPLMLYHTLQLLAGSILAQRMADKS